MKQSDKKLISVVLAVIVTFSVLAAVPVSVGAIKTDIADSSYTSGDYEYEILADGTAEISCYNGSETELAIPSTLDGYSVTSICDWAFFDCTSLIGITIPDSVTSIGNFAFEDCTSLIDITIPDSVISIGTGAFCNTVWYNNQPDGVVYAANIAYNYKGNMPSETFITLKDNITGIADGAFFDCTNLIGITIPDSVTNIGDWVFGNCTSLADITIPNSVTSIGNYAFDNCTSLIDITIPDSITSISCYAFEHCTSLKSITIPNSVTTIGYMSFYDCTSLESITIPDSVTSVDGWAFYGCTSLTDITIPSGVTSIGDSVFCSCTGITDITIPDSVTSIGYKAFGYYQDDYNYSYEKIDGFTIHGYKGSAAEVYATDNGIDFACISASYELGDVDGDGNISILDATQIQRHLAKIITLTDAQIAVSDTDADNKISVLDATTIQRYLAKLIDHLGE